jgi:hypothetical protein
VIGPEAVANIAKVSQALTQLLDPQDPGAGYTKGIPLTALQKNFCSQALKMKTYVIQTAKDKGKRRLVIRTVAKNGDYPRPKSKRSMLRLSCVP